LIQSVFSLSRAAYLILKKGDLTTIINIIIAGWNAGGLELALMEHSKAGVHALTRALAKDLADMGLEVNAVSPVPLTRLSY